MVDKEKEDILRTFCDRFEGREGEIGCKPIVYGDLLMMSQELDISVEDIASTLVSELNQLEDTHQ